MITENKVRFVIECSLGGNYNVYNRNKHCSVYNKPFDHSYGTKGSFKKTNKQQTRLCWLLPVVLATWKTEVEGR